MVLSLDTLAAFSWDSKEEEQSSSIASAKEGLSIKLLLQLCKCDLEALQLIHE